MRQLLKAMAPTTFDDVGALIALYRPGPMGANMHYDYADRKNGRKPVVLFHDDAADLLADTYGLMIYQESMMRVAQKFAGYSLAEADNLRKACGKKVREMMARERDSFEAGCERTGYGRQLGKTLFDIIERFADYAFNKSHSYGYGLITYQTAFLKAHYPVEYYACMLSSVKSNLDRAAVYLSDARAMGIRVLTPDINQSVTDFAALLPDDVPAERHPAGRQPGRDHVRALRRAQRRRGAGRATARRARRERAVRRLPRVRRTCTRGCAQQADGRVADQGRGVRCVWVIRGAACWRCSSR